MANQRIDDLTELSALDLADDDVLPVVDKTTNQTKKVKYGSFLARNNVLRYGADPTGVADSTTAFENCLAASETIFVPEGVYIVGDLELDSKGIEGRGTIKRKTGSTYCIIMQGDNPYIEGITFNTIASPVNGQSEIKLDDSCQYPAVRFCKFTGSLYATVSADANGADDTSLVYTNPVEGFTFESNTVFGTYSRHLYLHNLTNIRIINNAFKGSLRDCIRLRQATKQCLISGNTFDEIGQEYPSIIERPLNWVSITAYSLGQTVSIPPIGVFQCIVTTSTIGANPTTTGAAEWTNIAPGYFETKDILDAFWSGRELIITDNIIKKGASMGFGIKGVEPNGAYSTGRVIISNNYIEGCYGSAIELSNSQNTISGDFFPSNQYIITNNIIRKNNRERFDVANAAIYIRQGCRSVIISHNIIDSNYARGIGIRNSDSTAGIVRDILIDGNHIYSNGIPGNISAVGMFIEPVNGLTVINNIVRNYATIEEYKMVVAGTASSNSTITFPARGNAGGSLSIPVLSGDTFDVIKGKIADSLRDDYPVVYDVIPNTTYYTNIREEQGVASSVQFGPTAGNGRLVLTSDLPGTQGDGYTLVTIVDNARAPTVYPTDWTWDSGTLTLTVYIRSTTKPTHFIAAFNASAPVDARAVLSVALGAGEPSDIASQTAMTGETVTTSGGVDGDELFFDARLEELLTPGVFTGPGFTVTLTRDPLMTNSVQTYGIYLKDTAVVGPTTFEPPRLNWVIKNNQVAGNSVGDRFGVVLNDVEMPALIFYVDSNNSTNNTVITTQARTFFSTGANSQGGIFSVSSTQAYLIVQGIILRARDFGEIGNSITFQIEQQTGNNQPLRLQIAPAYAGGRDVVLRLPTDGSGSPLATTIAEAEAFIKTRCAQAVLAYEDNYINILRPQREGIKGDPAVSSMTAAVSTTQDVEVFRGGVDEMSLGATALDHRGRIEDLELIEDYSDPKVRFRITEHFISNTAVGNNGWTATANGGVNGMNISSSTGDEFGIIRLDTSTSSTAAPTLTLGASTIFFLTTTMSLEIKYQVLTLSTVGEEFIDRIGWHNSSTSAAPTNGIYFEYDRLGFGANWQAVTNKGGTTTREDTGVAVATGWVFLKIVVTNDADAKFYIGGTLVETITTNIPNASANAVGIALQKIKSAGTTARVSYCDFVDYKVIL